MASIDVDRTVCTGHARCHATSPELFPLDDDGFVDIGHVEIPEDALAKAQAGADACPERAIRIG